MPNRHKSNRPIELHSRDITCRFEPATLRMTVQHRHSRAHWSFDLVQNAWLKIGPSQGEWRKDAVAANPALPGKSARDWRASDDLPRHFLAPGNCAAQRRGPDAIDLEANIAGLRIAMRISLRGADGLEWTVYPADNNRYALIEAVFPGTPEMDGRRHYPVVFPRAQGMMFIPGSENYKYHTQSSGQGMTMRWLGGLGEHGAFMGIAEHSEDAALTIDYIPRKKFEAQFGWIHSMGSLRYTRRLFFRFLPVSSYVRLAACFREYAEAAGMVKTLKEKIAECPPLERLHGGALIMLGYFHDKNANYTKVVNRLPEFGIERGLVYPAKMDGFFTDAGLPPFVDLPAPTLAAIKNRGFLSGVFFCPCDIHAKHPLAAALARRANPLDLNDWPVSWQIGDNIYYRTHFGKAVQRFEQLFDLSQYDNIHFDVLGNAAGSCEDYAPDWPQNRLEHAESARQFLSHFARQGLVVSCEGKIDSIAAQMHWGTFRINTIPQYRKEGALPPHLRPVPLWHLVFHDCLFHSNWEHYTYNDGNNHGKGNPRVGYLHDLLHGDLPSVFAAGKLYRYLGGKDRRVEYYTIPFNSPLVAESLRLAAGAARHHRHVGLCRMISHRFINQTPLLQESVFENGCRVLVNFSEKAMAFDGLRVPAHDALISD